MKALVLPNRDALAMCLPKRKVVAEIGVFCGDFSKSILGRSFPKKLHLIDCWAYAKEREWPDAEYQEKNTPENWDSAYNTILRIFTSEIKQKQVQVHRGYSFEVLNQFPDSYFDWIYLDAEHSYSSVKRDLELSASKVKPEGLICGDDYIEGNPVDGFEYGVIEAVNEFCSSRQWRIICWADHLWEGENYRNFVIARKNFSNIAQARLAISYFFSYLLIQNILKRFTSYIFRKDR